MPKNDCSGKPKTSATYDADWVFNRQQGAWITRQQQRKFHDQEMEKRRLNAAEAGANNVPVPSAPKPPTTVPINLGGENRTPGMNVPPVAPLPIEKNYCINCKKDFNEELDFSSGVPKCNCGGLIRPGVVWFGEFLPEDQFRGGELAAMKADVFFVVGTSAVVYPAAGLVYTAKVSGATIVEINIEETEISSSVNYSYFGKAGEILPKIFEEYKSQV